MRVWDSEARVSTNSIKDYTAINLQPQGNNLSLLTPVSLPQLKKPNTTNQVPITVVAAVFQIYFSVLRP